MDKHVRKREENISQDDEIQGKQAAHLQIRTLKSSADRVIRHRATVRYHAVILLEPNDDANQALREAVSG